MIIKLEAEGVSKFQATPQHATAFGQESRGEQNVEASQNQMVE